MMETGSLGLNIWRGGRGAMKGKKILCPQCGSEVFRYENPVPTVDIIIEVEAEGRKRGIVLIHRKQEPRAWAIPGGFVDYGETVEQAAVREAREETGLEIDSVRQFHTYSDPARDPRRHTISTVFIARAKGKPHPGDDAEGAEIFGEENLPSPLAFDHDKILKDYFSARKNFSPQRTLRKDP
jgi:ADP-ribose pyrophosphatase YjhB (NUDIX family)